MGYKNRVFITGDTHRNFDNIEWFCDENNTTRNDIMIITGDAGINYFLDSSDDYIKKMLQKIPITFLILHGNHEERAWNVSGYKREQVCIGTNNIIAWREEKYPNLLFLDDYKELTLNDKSYLFLGGAYSVDKYYRLANGYRWFESEQISETDREEILHLMKKKRNAFDYTVTHKSYQYDYIVSHTCPFKYIPTEAFLPNIPQDTVDNSTEKFLDKIEDMTVYRKWYCGHWHINKMDEKMRFLFEDIVMLD